MKVKWDFLDSNLGCDEQTVAILYKDIGSEKGIPILRVRNGSRGSFFTNLSYEFQFLKAPSVSLYEASESVKVHYPDYINMDSKEYQKKLLMFACNKIEANILEQISIISTSIA